MGGRALLLCSGFSKDRFLSARVSVASRTVQCSCIQGVSFPCAVSLSMASIRVLSSKSACTSMLAKMVQKWFTDSINLQIMLTVSVLALKWMLSFSLFCLRVVPCSEILVPTRTGRPASLYVGEREVLSDPTYRSVCRSPTSRKNHVLLILGRRKSSNLARGALDVQSGHSCPDCL